jgi:hypothetical protein
MWHRAAKYEDDPEEQPEESGSEPVPVTSILKSERSESEYHKPG